MPVEGHTLCGVVDYADVTDRSDELNDAINYNSITRQFSIISENPALIETVAPYTIYGEFRLFPLDTYPTVSTDEASSSIVFQNPCRDPIITEPIQNGDPVSDSYTGEQISW